MHEPNPVLDRLFVTATAGRGRVRIWMGQPDGWVVQICGYSGEIGSKFGLGAANAILGSDFQFERKFGSPGWAGGQLDLRLTSLDGKMIRELDKAIRDAKRGTSALEAIASARKAGPIASVCPSLRGVSHRDGLLGFGPILTPIFIGSK